MGRDVESGPHDLVLRAFESIPFGVIVTDARSRILLANPAFTRITGYDVEEVRGRSPRLLQSGRHDSAFYRDMWRTIARDGVFRGEVWNRRKTGELYPEWLTISAIRDRNGRITNYVGLLTDITHRKVVERRLIRLAYTDPLTGLPNRALFSDRIDQALAQARRNFWYLAVLLVDLDGFKAVNDRYGHLTGDDVLREVARRLKKSLRTYDTVARIGGDEFVVLLPHIADTKDAVTVAENMIAVLDSGFDIRGESIVVEASIGISVFPDRGNDAAELVERADAAMYFAKRHGKHRVHLCDGACRRDMKATARIDRRCPGRPYWT